MSKVIAISDQNELVKTSNFPFAKWKFEEFNPVQSRLVEVYQNDSNIAIAASTSAGKTVCSEIYMSYEIRQNKKKAVYIAPLKALASEKHREWTNQEHHFADLKVSICTGDFRITDKRIKELDEADIIIMTPEMLSSRCRNSKSEKSNFLKRIGVIVFDESHLLTVPNRGDHIEVALVKLASFNPDARIVLLSATMPNVNEICEWIANLSGRDTYFLESKYRPVPLGISYPTYFDGVKTYEEKENEKAARAVGIINHFHQDKFLVFVHTKNTGKLMLEYLERYGITSEFHNSNLEQKKRAELENKFMHDPNFRVVIATSTLAWGVNLPARRVVIVGIDRGLSVVENYDINQMIGRAGRKGLDTRGDAYILVPESKKEECIRRLKHNPKIKSQLLQEVGNNYKTLAFHIVSEIHQGSVTIKDGFHDWFQKTLAFHQTRSLHNKIIDKTIDHLVQTGAITVENEVYKVTSTGVIASMFYYSPFDVANLRDNFQKLFQRSRENDDIFVSIALANIDSNRFQFVNKAEKLEMLGYSQKIREYFGENAIPEGSVKAGFAYYNLLKGKENATFHSIQQTIKQDSERTLEVLNAMDTMLGKWNKSQWINNLKTRITYGVPTELCGLISIPNIGRVKSEKLYRSKIKNVDDFANADCKTISSVLGIKPDAAQKLINSAKEVQMQNLIK